MGKPINKHTKDFDELLKHLNTPSDDLDGFEQEALEGFALLENEQEARDLKSKLDERIQKEVIKKRKPLFIYWSAAAGIALLAGLIFIFNNTSTLQKQELAQNTPLQDESKKLEFNQGPLGGATDKLETTLSEPAKTLSDKENEQTGSAEGGKKTANKRDENVQNAIAREDASQVTTPAEEQVNAESKNEQEAKPDLDDAKKSQQGPPPSAAGAGASDLAKTKSAAPAKDEEKDDKGGEKMASRKITKEKSKEAPGKASELPAAPESKTRSEINGTFENSNIKTATLTIKESELYNQLNKFLSDKSYKKTFSCTLTINSSNEVEEVTFGKEDLFKRSEIKELKAFFKKLKCFKANEYALYSTYKINYISQ